MRIHWARTSGGVPFALALLLCSCGSRMGVQAGSAGTSGVAGKSGVAGSGGTAGAGGQAGVAGGGWIDRGNGGQPACVPIPENCGSDLCGNDRLDSCYVPSGLPPGTGTGGSTPTSDPRCPTMLLIEACDGA